MAYQKDITGKKWNRLTAIKRLKKDANGVYSWLFQCDCGKKKAIRANAVTTGGTKSCGCRQGLWKHGFAKKKFYRVWQSIHDRCYNQKNIGYKNYGGRGIRVCSRWVKFENFKMDMLESFKKHIKSYGAKNTSIDRIDVNGNYLKSNCRWATKSQQQNNTRKTNAQ